MEAIKKKMQAMKVGGHLGQEQSLHTVLQVEKDNACDRVDVCEEQAKAAKVGSQWDLPAPVFQQPFTKRCWAGILQVAA